MLKFKEFALLLTLLALYLNIGWELGYYYHHNVSFQKFESASWHAKLLAGHCMLFAKDEAKNEAKVKSPLMGEIVLSVIWPFVLALSFVSWVCHIIFWVSKFIFAGGLFKLVFGIS